jgi:hypothetical protein
MDLQSNVFACPERATDPCRVNANGLDRKAQTCGYLIAVSV